MALGVYLTSVRKRSRKREILNDKQRKAKAYLSSYLVLVSQAERAYEDYERAYSRACRMTAGFGEACGNGGSSD